MSASEQSPWVARLEMLSDPDEIRRRTRVIADPVERLHECGVHLGAQRLKQALAEVFEPTDGIVSIISSLVGQAQAHAAMYYSDPRTVLMRANADSIDIEPYMPTCLSGPAGAGKSRLRRAISRLFGSMEDVVLGVGYGKVPHVPFTSVPVSTERSVLQILKPLARPEIRCGNRRITDGELPGDCAVWQAIVGGCLAGIDELQFLSHSEATALILRILHAVLGVKVPWFFVCNYSLCWRLLDRRPENTQRLLGRPVVLLPEPLGSNDWLRVLAALQAAAPDAFAFDFAKHEAEIWNMSSGLKRLVVDLLVLAYHASRHRDATTVSWLDVQCAYLSAGYKANRVDVEAVIAHAVQGGELRRDLRCPFEDDISSKAIKHYREQLRDARARKVVQAALDASMTVEERSRLADLTARAAVPAPVQSSGQVIKMPKRPRKPKTLESLLDAGRRLNDDL